MGARDNRHLNVSFPDAQTTRKMRMLLLHQYTFVSAPHIWNGDERGMWLADDPDCRKPVLWEDIQHKPETFDVDGCRRTPVTVKPNPRLTNYYRKLIAARKQRRELIYGDLEFVVANDPTKVLAYRRSLDGRLASVIFNASSEPRRVEIRQPRAAGPVQVVESVPDAVANLQFEPDKVRLELASESGAAIFLRQSPH